MNIQEYLPFLIPLIIVIVSLALYSAYHVWTHPHYRIGTRTIWLILVLFIQIIGPLLYFAIGRDEEA